MWAENASDGPILKSAGLQNSNGMPANRDPAACLFAREFQVQDTGMPSRSPLGFDPMPDRTSRPFREGSADSRSPAYDAAALLAASDATCGPRSQTGRSAGRRRDLLIEEMKDLLERAVIYALAVLGLLHVLGLVATA